MIGKQISNYTITAHLGQGGMGNVFKATDNMLGREVALKMLHPQLTSQPQFLERFRKEARILARLLHPNIAVIYNFFEQQGDHYMVMEYVDGVNVDELLKQHYSLPPEIVVPIANQALEGLQHAHRKNIFHRDIKPANLMITNDDLVKLMDFGIAKVSGEQKLTQVNKIVGTIEFMAPELIQGKDASAASDIYSMGATMYEMVTGKIPFEADSDYNLMQAILKSKPTPPEKLNAAVPAALSNAILRAMDKDPGKRFADARSFQSALIAAFPQYRQIDFSNLKKGPATLTTRVVQHESETRFAGGNPVLNVKELITNPSEIITAFKELPVSKKRIAAIAALLLLLLISGYFIFRNGGKEHHVVLNTNNVEPENKTKQQDRNPYETPDAAPGADLPQRRRIPPAGVFGEQEPVINSPVINNPKNEIPNNRKKSNISVITDKGEQQNRNDEHNKKEQEKPKSITITGGTSIILKLATKLDMNQEKKTPQQVSFRVVRPVYQNGTLIIREGATATGSITVGRVLTDIVIDQVETVTGKRISVKSDKAHGRVAQLTSGNSFTAITVGGATLNF